MGNNRGLFSTWALILSCFLSCTIHTVSSKNDIFATTTQNTVENINHYSMNGSNNNIDFPDWGRRLTPRIRHLPNASLYFDQIAPNTGGGIPVDEENYNLPSARRIMENVFSKALANSDKGTNHLMLEFGHFIVQDIIGRTLMNEEEPFPIPCDGKVTDVVFCPVTGKSIPFDRSQHVTFDNPHKPRASLNRETAFLDMSNMYGNTPALQKQIRAEEGGGRVKMVDFELGGLPPILDKYNSSPGVFTLYTVFMRYHNVLADQIKADAPLLTDEDIFQQARHKMIAIYQFIAEEKYIPMLLGSKLSNYTGYNASVDPSIDEFFAAASFRYAHSSFSGLVRLLDENFNPTGSDPLLLRDVFRQPAPNDVPRTVRNHGGVEPFLRGLTVTAAKAVDASLVHDMNYFSEATSLLDIQRGRDLGLPSYNDARIAFGLNRTNSFEDLLGYDNQNVLGALKELYNNSIDKLDVYVGALVEAKDTNAEMGPLFTRSIKNQFERIRDGDRLWYKKVYPTEWEQFPSLTELIQATSKNGTMDNFPTESFLAWDGVVVGGGGDAATCATQSTQLSLLDGKYTLGWKIEDPTAADLRDQPDMRSTIEVTMTINERMDEPGFIGVGWGKQKMKGAEIWFCTVNEDLLGFEEYAASCNGASDKVNSKAKLFSCCVCEGGLHIQPVCSDSFYDLTVVDWCLTPGSTMVSVTAPICDINDDHSDGKGCFHTTSKENGEMDFIVAYNENNYLIRKGHGYQKRTSSAVDLSKGIQTQSETGTADEGLVATHAMFMLCAWMIFAPGAVFIARYMKTRQWRLVWHVSLMGIVGSLMLPLLIGIEASVGATDKTQEHSFVGLILCGVYFFMVFAGRVRYLKLQGKKVGRKTYLLSFLLHKYGGAVMVLLAWWNCYTGLVRIGPEDSYFQVFLLSSFPLGYNLEVFGFIQQYVFFPYLGAVCFAFIVAEARRYRLSSSSHASKLQGILEGTNTIWEDDADKFLEKMSMDSFMEATKLGTILCIVDGYVLDITSFVENHPGGQHLLRYAAGSDITEEFVGKRDVDGMRHTHSQSAVQLMKTFVKAILVDEDNHKLSFAKGHSRTMANSLGGGGFRRMSLMETIARGPKSMRSAGASVFRRGRVVGLKYLTPDIDINHTSKPVILLQLALPKTRKDLRVQKLISLPSCAFTFRGIDRNKTAVDRQYTPVSIHHDYTNKNRMDDEEEIFDFVISLVPGGKMTKILLDARVGNVLLAQGPTINQETVAKFRTGGWRSVVMIAAGTGVSPMLQVIDYYIMKLSTEFNELASELETEVPNMYLMWIVKGPEYNYAETLALDARVDKSQGKFKYIVIYTTSSGKRPSFAAVEKNRPNQWSFKQLMDKTNPKKLGYRKHKKVKREVLDAAWKSKKQSSRKKKQDFGVSEDFSIENEITEAVWSDENVEACYRSYNKMLLEELLLSIPKTNVALQRSPKQGLPRKKKDSFDSSEDNKPFEDLYDDEGQFSSGSHSDSRSDDFRPGSDSYTGSASYLSGSYGFLSRITEITDDSLSVKSDNYSKGKNSKVPGSISLSEKEENGTVSTERSGSSPESSPPADLVSDIMTSWRPPNEQDRSPWMGSMGIDAAKHATYASDYVSFDHKQLKSGFTTASSGTVSIQNPPPPKPKHSHRIPPRLGSPPPEPKSSTVPYARNIPLSQNKSARTNRASPNNIISERQERPSLEDRTPSKTLKTQTDSRKLLSKQETTLGEMLHQHELNEVEYRDRRMIIAISGAPMFEYKTRVNLGELGFPSENMVTFHASAQQL